MNKIFGLFFGGRGAVATLLLRLVFGVGIAIHGWGKVQGGGFHWADKMGIPTVLQGLAAYSEFLGGIGIVVGFLTPLAALGVACTMGYALCTVHFPHGDPFVTMTHGPSFESALEYFIVAVALIIAGPGAFSLDALIFGRTKTVVALAPGEPLPMARPRL